MVQKKKGRIIKGPGSVFCMLLLFSFFLTSCAKDQKVEAVVNYTGPAIEADHVETLYSDSSVLRIRLTAPKQLELQNGDRTFPKGVYIEFFDKEGKKTSTLTANSGTFFKDQNNYHIQGNVIIKNLEEKKQLNTEELNWDPDTKKVNTDKYVRIETPEQILTGQGLEADQDFTFYKIIKPIGVFDVGDDEEEDDEE